MTQAGPRTVALAIGDPNGIGPEIAVKAAAALAQGSAPRVILVGDPQVIRYYAKREAPGFSVREFNSAASGGARDVIDMLPVVMLPLAQFKPGQIAADAGKATVAYVEAAIRLVRSGAADAVVGCPHNETAVNAAGIRFSGYPGLVAQLTGVPEDRVFLLLIGGGLRIIHATLHERLHDALARLTPELIEAAGQACARALKMLGIAAPKIGVFGINPHAGENGLFGDDDEKITRPAVARLRAAGVQAEGPAGADLMLGRRDLDGFVAAYHDQGHIPIKLVAGRTATALAVGADVLFASVGHGSAFDIAGQGRADPEAVLRTLRLVGGAAPGGASDVAA
jgi:4-hydroxy-L-threonine phosphate dehydrogenase PdxA